MSLEKLLALKLIEQNKTLSIAESCTGGLLSNRLTNIPGSSNFLKFSIVAYSNASKSKFLKIPSAYFKKYGAVSEPVAKLMAENVRKILKTVFGVAITGIAGPTGSTKEKPLGLTFIAISTAETCRVHQFIFKGSRLQVKQQASTQALKLLLKEQ